MGFIRSVDAIPVLADNLTICPQASTNASGGFVFPAAEALISIGPAIGDCFARLKATKPLSTRMFHPLGSRSLFLGSTCLQFVRKSRIMVVF